MRNETNTKFAMKLCRVKCAISSSASADLLYMHVGCNIIKLAQHKVISFFFHQNREHENRCQKMHTSALNSHLNIRFHFSSFFCSRSLLFSAARCWLFRLWHWRASLLLVVVIHIIVEALENYNNGKFDLFVVRASRITFKWIIFVVIVANTQHCWQRELSVDACDIFEISITRCGYCGAFWRCLSLLECES